ncbi:MAG: Type 1 glutamine amidotransferase-like domain-containing protein [Oligoflexus sp.]
MKLWLYSSGDGESNRSMDLALLRNLAEKQLTFTFIPSSYDTAAEYYDEFIERFSELAYINFHIMHADRPLMRKDRFRALNSDVIYLSGGNTFYLLDSLRRADLLEDLRYFVDTGGLLAGHSAGAIMMTPSIDTASYPDFDCDDNEVELFDWRGLGLVNFEYFPHYRNSARYSECLKAESKRGPGVIYGVPDGSGIVVVGRQITFFSTVWGFVGGHKFRVGLRA